jgi:rare lipoprotein A (peptidoglycan hydrolase)
VVVPVIDRGPYGQGASWDLTAATAAALGVATTTRIWTLFPPPHR